MDKSTLHEEMTMPNKNFPIKLTNTYSKGINKVAVSTHWHREIELLFIIKGSVLCRCNNTTFTASEGDLIVVNCNELHFCQNLTEDLQYYCIIADPNFLNGRFIDLCDSKYITPIIENKILFKNIINNDKDIKNCINSINNEFNTCELGFELSIKASLYKLIVLLLRKYVSTILTDSEAQFRIKNIDCYNSVIKYIKTHYAEELNLDMLSNYAHLSKFHFCRMFKKMTGNTINHYINLIRVEESEQLLLTTDLSISQIALSVGFNDTSYFSKVYKNFKSISPSEVRHVKKTNK